MCRVDQHLTARSGRERGQSEDFGPRPRRWDGSVSVRFPEPLQDARGREELLPRSRAGERLFEPSIQVFLTAAFEALELLDEHAQPGVVVRSEVVQSRDALAYSNW